MDTAASLPQQTRGEEIANCVSHGIGLMAAVAVTPWLIVNANRHGATSILGVAVFAGSMILLYLASTIYHALPQSRAKDIMRTLDHVAIFLLIAGTYTPFTLGVLRGVWGWTLFGLVWGMALLGSVLRILGSQRLEAVATGLYLAMGWMCLIAAKPIWLRIPIPGLIWLAAGGLAYSVGTAFFVADRLRFNHLVWHLFVVVGTACHVVAVCRYAG